MNDLHGLRVILGADDDTRPVTMQDFRAHQAQNNRMQTAALVFGTLLSIFLAHHYRKAR